MKEKVGKTKRYNFHLLKRIHGKCKKLAKEKGVSMSGVFREFEKEWLKRSES